MPLIKKKKDTPCFLIVTAIGLYMSHVYIGNSTGQSVYFLAFAKVADVAATAIFAAILIDYLVQKRDDSQ